MLLRTDCKQAKTVAQAEQRKTDNVSWILLGRVFGLASEAYPPARGGPHHREPLAVAGALPLEAAPSVKMLEAHFLPVKRWPKN